MKANRTAGEVEVATGNLTAAAAAVQGALTVTQEGKVAAEQDVGAAINGSRVKVATRVAGILHDLGQMEQVSGLR
jgi:hypothetical protein